MWCKWCWIDVLLPDVSLRGWDRGGGGHKRKWSQPNLQYWSSLSIYTKHNCSSSRRGDVCSLLSNGNSANMPDNKTAFQSRIFVKTAGRWSSLAHVMSQDGYPQENKHWSQTLLTQILFELFTIQICVEWFFFASIVISKLQNTFFKGLKFTPSFQLI